MKVFVPLAALLAVVAAEPYYGYPGLFYHGYPHQQHWPGVRAPGFEATCFGCRGKRSAEPGIAHHPGHATSYVHTSPFGYPGYHFGPYYHPLGKRDAEEAAAPAEEVAPEEAAAAEDKPAATYYVGQTVWGFPKEGHPLSIAKRSAEPGLAFHPGRATSYVHNSPFGYPGYHLGPYYHHLGKRSAEPGYYHGLYHGLGYYGYPRSTSYVGRTIYGYPY